MRGSDILPGMKTSRRVIGAVLSVLPMLAAAAFGAADEWVFEGDIERDAAAHADAPLESPFFSSVWAEEPSNVIYGFDTTAMPGFLLFLR